MNFKRTAAKAQIAHICWVELSDIYNIDIRKRGN